MTKSLDDLPPDPGLRAPWPVAVSDVFALFAAGAITLALPKIKSRLKSSSLLPEPWAANLFRIMGGGFLGVIRIHSR